MGIFPFVLYGSAIRPPSSDTLDSLRSSTAQAFMSSCLGISAAICLLLAPGGILDPEYWMFCMIFRTVWLFLLHATPDVKLGFLCIASSFRGPLASVWGPASGYLKSCFVRIQAVSRVAFNNPSGWIRRVEAVHTAMSPTHVSIGSSVALLGLRSVLTLLTSCLDSRIQVLVFLSSPLSLLILTVKL